MWVLDELLRYFFEELQAKESYLENQNTESEKNKHGFIASGLYSENRERKIKKWRCSYCLGKDHSPSHCLKVTNLILENNFEKISEIFYMLEVWTFSKNCNKTQTETPCFYLH